MISKFRWDFNRHQPVLEISSVPHVLPFLPANVSLVTPELISSLWLALRPQGRFRVHVLLLEYVSTFLLRLVSTLVSLVSSVRLLSALFSSSRFLASLVNFGYLAFCLLFLSLPCCYFSFVAPFLFVYRLIAHLELAY